VAGLLALLCWLVGRGLALTGKGDGRSQEPRQEVTALPPQGQPAALPPRPEPAAPQWESAGVPALGLRPGLPAEGTGQNGLPAAVPVAASEAGEAGEAGAAVAASTLPAAAGAGVAADPDQVQALRSLVGAALEDRRFALAARALALLQELAATDPAAVALDGLAAELAAARVAAAGALQQQLAAGRALAAEWSVAALASADLAELVAALPLELAATGLPADLDAAFAVPVGPLPLPRALSPQRAVRWWQEQQPVVGMVVDSRPLAASVRLVVGGAVHFPRLHVAELEPLQASAAEALELALAARHAGRPRRARLWYLAAVAMGGEVVAADRREQVLELLR
jgi:hypothetical protein